jgi:hypothetical protein
MFRWCYAFLLLLVLADFPACSAFQNKIALPDIPFRRNVQLCMSSPDLRPKPIYPVLGTMKDADDGLSNRVLETRILRLERRVAQLNTLIEDVCSAVLHCDDVALMERHARGMGDVYFDTAFSTSRKPRMLRPEIVQIMNRHNISDKPLMYTWKNNRCPTRRPSGEIDQHGDSSKV